MTAVDELGLCVACGNNPAYCSSSCSTHADGVPDRREQQHLADDQDHTEHGHVARVLPSPREPMRVARTLLDEEAADGQLTLRRWRGGWMRWCTTHWREQEDAEVRAWLYRQVEHA